MKVNRYVKSDNWECEILAIDDSNSQNYLMIASVYDDTMTIMLNACKIRVARASIICYSSWRLIRCVCIQWLIIIVQVYVLQLEIDLNFAI
jgi:hypothetical protein